jgi:hypothetical protein
MRAMDFAVHGTGLAIEAGTAVFAAVYFFQLKGVRS